MIFEEGNEDMDSQKKDLESDLCVFGVTLVSVYTLSEQKHCFSQKDCLIKLSLKLTVLCAWEKLSYSTMSYIAITFVFMVPA